MRHFGATQKRAHQTEAAIFKICTTLEKKQPLSRFKKLAQFLQNFALQKSTPSD